MLVWVSKASHVPGGNITYECIGPNQYAITLTVYEDCGTAFIGTTPESITITNDCGLVNPGPLSATQTVFQQEISQLCPTALSECDGGIYPGVYMHQYTAIVTLPAGCDSWHFSYSSCCRNTATNSVTSDAYYWVADLNSTDAPCNNSPFFTSPNPVPYGCVGSAVCYSLGTVETDGDSLSFALIDAQSASGVSITYVAGYSGAVPIPGITIDPVTGQIEFTPTVAGNYIVTVQVTEYNSAGVVIGTVLQDFQFEIVACTNDIVDCSTAGVIPSSTIIGAVVQTGPTTLQMCEGVPFCFTVSFTDPDAADILTITSNVLSVLPGATLVTTPGNTATAQICWTPPAGSASSFTSFTLTVADNACPVSGQQTIVYTMDVISGTVVNSNLTICGSQVANLTASGGSTFTWSVLSGPPIVVGTNFSCNPCANPVATPTSTTTYLVTSDLVGACTNTDTVTVFVVPDFAFSVTQSSPTSCLMSDVFITTTITGGTGTGPFTYEWTPAVPGFGPTNVANPTFTPSVPGAYDFVLEVQNAFGCTYTDTVSISVAPAYAPDATALATADTIFCGDNVGLTVDLGGGIPATCGVSLSACSGVVSTINVGTFASTNTTTTYPTPFGNWYANEKHHFLYTAAELNSMGFIGGKISAIGFNVVTLGGLTTYPGYTVRIACTGLTALPSGFGTPFTTAAFSTVYGPVNTTITAGLNTLNFSSPYEWDGVSNLLIEVCYTWTASGSYTTNSTVQLSNTTFTSSNWFNSDGTLACPNPTISSASNTRPVTMFKYCPADPDTTAFSYLWTPANTSPTSMTTSASPCTTTTYQVVVTDLAGGCTDTSLVTVYVMPTCFPPNPIVTNISCNGATDGGIIAQMVGTTGPWTVEWSQGSTVLATHPGITTTDSLVNLPAGTYTITITDTSGCTDDTTITLTEPLPLDVTAVPDDSICIGGSYNLSATGVGGTMPLTYTWSGGLTATGAGPHSISPTANDFYVVTLSDANGCTIDDDTVFVSLYSPIVAFSSGDVQLCQGASVVLTAGATGGMGGPYFVSWYLNGSSTAFASDSPVTVSPTTNNAQYCAIITEACTSPADTVCLITSFYPEPFPQITADTTQGCSPVEVTFSHAIDPSLIGNVSWNFGDGATLISNATSVTHNYTVPNTDCYDVYLEITSPQGCVHDTTYTDMICVFGYPIAAFTYEPQPVTVLNSTVVFDEFSSADAVSYQWIFYDSTNTVLGTSNLQNPEFTFPNENPGSYPVWLIVTNNNGCIDSVQLTVVIIDNFNLYIPNSFTPNGDGVNDMFIPVGTHHDTEEYTFYVFDRWGQQVFKSTKPYEGWDGTSKGIKSKEDVYVWKIVVKSDLDKGVTERIGHVTLIR